MSNPAELHPDSQERSRPEIHEAEIYDSAFGLGDQVRCLIEDLGDQLATDWMRFNAHSTPEGWYFPKKGDRAIVAQHVDGPDALLEWWPAVDAVPDVLA